MTEEESTRQHLSADERRHLLVQAALRVMKREGVQKATTRAICAEAGMPHGIFHYCFHSKRELYAALLSTDTNIDLEEAWTRLNPAADVGSSIQALFDAYWNLTEADPEAQIVISELTALALRDPELRELPEWGQQAYRRNVIRHLERFADSANIEYTLSTTLLADLILAALSGITTSWLATRNNEAARQAIDEFANIFVSYTKKVE